MMILSAVVLLIGFIALAGMVSRVSQLGSQTAIEADQAILSEVSPLADSLDGSIADLLAGRTVTTGTKGTTAGSNVLESQTAAFFPQDVGKHIRAASGATFPTNAIILGYTSPTKVTLGTTPTTVVAANATATALTLTIGFVTGTTTSGSTTVTTTAGYFGSHDVGRFVTGPGIMPGTTIASVTNSRTAVLSQAANSGAGAGVQLAVGRFALSTITTPTFESALITLLERLQAIESTHGMFLDWEIVCGAGGAAASSQVVLHLSDGTVWLEIKSRSDLLLPRTTTCTDSGGACTSPATYYGSRAAGLRCPIVG